MIGRWFFVVGLLAPVYGASQDLSTSEPEFLGHIYQESATQSKSYYPNFTHNKALTKKMRALMRRYLLPLDHPAKHVLDEIFSHQRVIRNERTLQAAGFKILHAQKKSFIRVISHPRLKGYLIKVYIDAENNIPSGASGWKRLTVRCVVAEKIKKLISQHHIRNFVVADKWVYPLPDPKTCKAPMDLVVSKGGAHRQPIILLVKDMKIYNVEKSKVAWKRKATRRTLSELYTIFSRGLGSAFLSGNLPYTRHGKFAFIDTEFGRRHLPMEGIKKYFNPKMSQYWDSLIRSRSSEQMCHPQLLAE